MIADDGNLMMIIYVLTGKKMKPPLDFVTGRALASLGRRFY